MTKCKEISRLKTEHVFVLINIHLVKIYQVGNHSVNMGVVEI